jgi:hypothetical protein
VYQREHSVANRQRCITIAGKRRRAVTIERMTYLIAYRLEHPCVDCPCVDCGYGSKTGL